MGCRTDEIERKTVINTCDGKCLGYIHDYEIDLCDGRITAVFVCDRAFGFGRSEIRIPWSKIVKIGEDAILADAPPSPPRECDSCPPPKKHKFF